MLECSFLEYGGKIHLKISDEVVHSFILGSGKVLSYSVTKYRGEPIANSTAELIDVQEKDGKISGLRIRTEVLDFEVLLNRNYGFDAYKSYGSDSTKTYR
ncbi:hypothetical protein [Methanocella sp. MCL-LM]|uniref:hypothetical protein n=1 Tax=Methanocella sp. MCL-LM TaxID=3412035 RepID=UPI003C75FD03